ncbi:MAG: helix-turn-helix transcriptional regulator [Flavobacterium sp.]|nr:helix-turn-helix transcriptional regulator [Flavobacterium sp.]
MKNSKVIRTKFGMSQIEMAICLQIPRSQLAMYENGKRDLPTHALVKLAEMELFLLNYNAQPNKSLPLESEQLQKAIEIFEKHQKKLEFQQLILQKKLDNLQTNYKYNMQLLEFFTEKEEKNPGANPLEKSWIAMMKTTALRNIEANGLHHQAKIKLELQMNIPQDRTDFINNLRISITNS